MNIGITTIYAHRPIIFFAAYLAKQLKVNGDNVSSLVCDASLPTCHSILSKGKNKLTECPICILGGLRSFDINSYYSINNKSKAQLKLEDLDKMIFSSIMTLERAENKNQIAYSNKEIKKLREAVSITYQNTLDWIQRDKLDLVICYNGRMDNTNAILKACKDSDINFISLERSTYGYGMQLIPNNNCLSLHERKKMNAQFKNIELSEKESVIANWLADTRISQKSHLEWRTYSSTTILNNDFDHPKVLILPSSNCETIGNTEWDNSWGHFTKALDKLLTKNIFNVKDIAIKMHPVWDQFIGQKNGEHITSLYSEWATKRNIRIINSGHAISTIDLIKQAAYIIVGGSSAGIDAALLGKKVILLGHAHYEEAGFVCHIKDNQSWGELSKAEHINIKETILQARTYLYTSTFRFNQLTNKIIPLNYFDYIYKEDSLDCIYSMYKKATLPPWEINLSRYQIAKEIKQEGKVIFKNDTDEKIISVKRKFAFRYIDNIRKFFPRGDQIKRSSK